MTFSRPKLVGVHVAYSEEHFDRTGTIEVHPISLALLKILLISCSKMPFLGEP